MKNRKKWEIIAVILLIITLIAFIFLKYERIKQGYFQASGLIIILDEILEYILIGLVGGLIIGKLIQKVNGKR